MILFKRNLMLKLQDNTMDILSTIVEVFKEIFLQCAQNYIV